MKNEIKWKWKLEFNIICWIVAIVLKCKSFEQRKYNIFFIWVYCIACAKQTSKFLFYIWRNTSLHFWMNFSMKLHFNANLFLLLTFAAYLLLIKENSKKLKNKIVFCISLFLPKILLSFQLFTIIVTLGFKIMLNENTKLFWSKKTWKVR